MFLWLIAKNALTEKPIYKMRLKLLHKLVNICGRMGLLQLVQRDLWKHGILLLIQQRLYLESENDPSGIPGRHSGIVVKPKDTNFLMGQSQFNVCLFESLGGSEIHQLFVWKWIFNEECGGVTISNPSWHWYFPLKLERRHLENYMYIFATQNKSSTWFKIYN